tara:strand:+ start:521 stop:1042 length:522 start_codon:yes stop_codon:yes gene_type:complete
MKKKKREQLTKTLMVAFLLLVALGFMVPGFLDLGENNQQYAEPKICQTDSDCYLMCGEDNTEPVEVFCAENLCQQNFCDEYTPFKYQQEPVTFTLEISNLTLTELSNSQDLFVKFSNDQVQMFTTGLSLDRILEKLNYNFNIPMTLEINGEESDYYGGYVPAEDDIIEILFGS